MTNTWQDETVQALKQGYQDEIDKLQKRITSLETAGRELLEVCHCTNDCANDDMSCATNKMIAALYGFENVSRYRAALLDRGE